MTNYEWLVENKDELVKDILTGALGKYKGKIDCCERINCDDCDFSELQVEKHLNCEFSTREWLEAEYMPQYNKGDIVLCKNEALAFVVEDTGEGVYLTDFRNYIEDGFGSTFYKYEYIVKKVGNIDK